MMPSGPWVGPRCHCKYDAPPRTVVMMSMSGAFDASTSAVVTPRPARPSGVRDSVRPNRVCVRLSIPLVIYLHDSTLLRRDDCGDDRGGVPAGTSNSVELGGAPVHHAPRDRDPAPGHQDLLYGTPGGSGLSLHRSGSVAGCGLGRGSQSFRKFRCA